MIMTKYLIAIVFLLLLITIILIVIKYKQDKKSTESVKQEVKECNNKEGSSDDKNKRSTGHNKEGSTDDKDKSSIGNNKEGSTGCKTDLNSVDVDKGKPDVLLSMVNKTKEDEKIQREITKLEEDGKKSIGKKISTNKKSTNSSQEEDETLKKKTSHKTKKAGSGLEQKYLDEGFGLEAENSSEEDGSNVETIGNNNIVPSQVVKKTEVDEKKTSTKYQTLPQIRQTLMNFQGFNTLKQRRDLKLLPVIKFSFASNEEEAENIVQNKKANDNLNDFFRRLLRFLSWKACQFRLNNEEQGETAEEELYIADVQSIFLLDETFAYIMTKEPKEWTKEWFSTLGLRPESLSLLRNLLLCEDFTDLTVDNKKFIDLENQENARIPNFDEQNLVIIESVEEAITYSALDFFNYTIHKFFNDLESGFIN